MGIINTALTGDTVASDVNKYDAVTLVGTQWEVSTSSAIPDGIYGGNGIIYNTVSIVSGQAAGTLPITISFSSSSIETITATITITADLTSAVTIGVSAQSVAFAKPEHITAHTTAAINRLLEQYKGTNLEDLIEALYGEQVQDIEDMLQDFCDRTNIDLSVGNQLDKIGELVGLKRNFLDDSIYRIFLKAQIVANNSNGQFEDIVKLWTLLSQSETINVEEVYPAEINLYCSEEIDSSNLTLIVDLVEQTLMSGVSLGYISNFFDSAAFSFAEGDGLGFGSIYDPSIGGEFASLIYHK